MQKSSKDFGQLPYQLGTTHRSRKRLAHTPDGLESGLAPAAGLSAPPFPFQALTIYLTRPENDLAGSYKSWQRSWQRSWQTCWQRSWQKVAKIYVKFAQTLIYKGVEANDDPAESLFGPTSVYIYIYYMIIYFINYLIIYFVGLH